MNKESSFKRNILYIVEGSDEDSKEIDSKSHSEKKNSQAKPAGPMPKTQRIKTEYTKTYGVQKREIQISSESEEPNHKPALYSPSNVFAVDSNSYTTSFRGPPPALVMMKESVGEWSVQNGDERFGMEEFTNEKRLVPVPEKPVAKPRTSKPKSNGSSGQKKGGQVNGKNGDPKNGHKNGYYQGMPSKKNFTELCGGNKHNLRKYNGGPEYWEDIEDIEMEPNDDLLPLSYLYCYKQENMNGRFNRPKQANEIDGPIKGAENGKIDSVPVITQTNGLKGFFENKIKQKDVAVPQQSKNQCQMDENKLQSNRVYQPKNLKNGFNGKKPSGNDLRKEGAVVTISKSRSFGADEFGVDYPSQEFKQPSLDRKRVKPDDFILKGQSKQEILMRANEVFGFNSVHTGPQRELENQKNNIKRERMLNHYQKFSWQNKYVTSVIDSDDGEFKIDNKKGHPSRRDNGNDEANEEIDSLNSSEEEAIVLEKTLQSFEDETITGSTKSLEEMSSSEQKAIRDAIFDHDVIVEAVAGSGKTTTILLVADAWEKANLGDSVLLTYNKRLRAETQQRASRLGLTRLEVHTLHSFCWRYYPGDCSDDAKMSEVVAKNLKPKIFSRSQGSFRPNFFIIDEAQDLNELYFKLIVKILRDFNFGSRIMMLGDRYQMIYEYRGADWRYFWMADELLREKGKGLPREWLRMPLTTSYRVHNHLAHFVNKCLLHQDLIVPAVEVGPKLRPIYCYENLFSINLWNRLHKLINCYTDNDVFILSYSIKSRESPMRRFANWLSEQGHSVHIAEEDETLSGIVMKDKIVFTTFHQSKGLERKLVVIFGFDAFLYQKKKKSYFSSKDQGGGDISKRCPNEVYVAVTRSREKCVMLQGEGAPPLKCIAGCEKLEEYADFWGNVENGFGGSEINNAEVLSAESSREALDEKNRFHMGVKDLVNHLPYNIAQKAKDMVRFIQPVVVGSRADHSHTIAQQLGGKWESVAEINSVGIPMLAELRTRQTASLLIERVVSEAVKSFYLDSVLKDEKDKEELLERMGEFASNILGGFTRMVDKPIPSVPQILFIANEYCSIRSGSSFKLRQIQDYNWLAELDLKRVFDNLNFKLESAAFNISVFLKLDAKKFLSASGFDVKSLDLSQKDDLLLHGQVDIMTEGEVVMIKGSGSIRDDDLIRMIALAFLLENGGTLTRAFHPMADLSEHHSIVSKIAEGLRSNFIKNPDYKQFAEDSAIRVREEMKMMAGFVGADSKKRYMIINPFSGERVQVVFNSREHLNAAMMAILDYKLSSKENTLSDEQFVKKTKKILGL